MSRLQLIELRRGSAAAWAAANPILADGEPGWDDTTPALKIGDGVHTWSALPSAGGGGATGPAGGALAGAFPNPTLASTVLNALDANGTPGVEGLALLLTATAAAARTSLGLGTAATQNTGAFDAAGAAAAAQAAAIAASQPLATILSNIVANGTPGVEGLALLLTATAAAARTSLGLGTAALNNTGDFAPATTATGAALATTGTVNLDLSALNGTKQSIGQTGALNFTTTNLSGGREVTLFIKNTTGGALAVTYPAWIAMTAALIASIPAGKTLTLSLSVPNGVVADAGVVAATAVQP